MGCDRDIGIFDWPWCFCYCNYYLRLRSRLPLSDSSGPKRTPWVISFIFWSFYPIWLIILGLALTFWRSLNAEETKYCTSCNCFWCSKLLFDALYEAPLDPWSSWSSSAYNLSSLFSKFFASKIVDNSCIFSSAVSNYKGIFWFYESQSWCGLYFLS